VEDPHTPPGREAQCTYSFAILAHMYRLTSTNYPWRAKHIGMYIPTGGLGMPRISAFPLFAGFWCSSRQYGALQRLAHTTGRTKSEVLRDYLEQQAQHLDLAEDNAGDDGGHEPGPVTA
jgi:hypothetical protein